jgi:hypothetical protein
VSDLTSFVFSTGMNMAHNATSAWWSMATKHPLNMSSVTNNSSAVSISQAARPFRVTIPSSVNIPNLHSTRERWRSSSRNFDSCVVLISFFNATARSMSDALARYVAI